MLARSCLAAAALCAASALHAYTFTGSHWYSATIPMQLQLGASGALTDGSTSWGASAEDALSTWNSNIGVVRFTVVRDSTAAKAQGNRLNNVFFSDTVYGQAWGSGVLAVTLTFTSNGTQSTECDVLFNQTLSWDSYRGAQRYGASGTIFDFHRVALHEFGHVLGLDHPDQAGQSVSAVMNSRISNLDSLTSDDIAGAQSIYSAPVGTATAPTISAQPASQTVTAGSSVSFSVTATSSTTPSYQWRKDGVALSGATSATLSLPGVTTASSGAYSVVVTNSAGSTTSSSATLTVTSPVVPAGIVTGPSSQTVSAGTRVTFTVTASGTAPLTYAWSKNGSPIPGATQSSCTIASAQASDAGNYTATVSNSAGAATSGAAVLVVTSAPVITSQPASQSLTVGSALTLTVQAVGTPAPAYQWSRDGVAIAGATSASFSIASVRTTDAGSYTVRVASSAGAVTSAPATVTISALPAITSAPTTQTISVGTSLRLSVTASGSPAPSYQWQKNGVNIAGATQSTFTIAAAAPSDSGTYTVVVTNAAGSVTSTPAQVTVVYSQLVNLSTRGFIPTGGALTAGFILRGSSDKPVIIRGIGPALYSYGLANALLDPQLAVIAQDSSQTLAANSSWSSTPQLSSEFQNVGAFPLAVGSNDSATELRLNPGAYTTRITSDTDSGGIALAEVYDADTAATPASRLINLSTRGFAGSGDNALVAGFSVRGTVAKRLLVRAVGPGIAPYGVTSVLANPRLDVYPAGGSTVIAANDDWGSAAEVKAAMTASGAFTIADGSRDAAVVLTVDPGTYTVVVTGVGGTTGNVLVEIYDLDP
jgi:hypothetical protein